MESPPYRGGQSRGSSLLNGLMALGLASVHCSAPRALVARSFEMRWTVPVPMPSDLATFKIPTPFASCFRTLRSGVLSSFGRPSFTPWATARLFSVCPPLAAGAAYQPPLV